MKLKLPGSPRPLSPSALAWLRCFEAAGRCGSFTRAAQELHVSPGAVSQQVKKLEDRLDQALFVRAQEGLSLTPAGQRLFAVARDALRSLESEMHRLQTMRAGEPLNVSCSPSFAMFWLTLRLGSFYSAYPHMALRIVGESGHVDPDRMAQENIVAAILFGSADSRNPNAIELFEEWLVPVATPSFMQSHPQLQAPGDLLGTHMLHAGNPWEGTDVTDEWAMWLGALGIPVSLQMLRQGTQFNHSLLSMQAALGGQGIAMGRLALVLRYLQQGRLVVPFRMRVRLNSSYSLIGSPLQEESPVVVGWLLDEAKQFKEQRDAFFAEAAIAIA